MSCDDTLFHLHKHFNWFESCENGKSTGGWQCVNDSSLGSFFLKYMGKTETLNYI